MDGARLLIAPDLPSRRFSLGRAQAHTEQAHVHAAIRRWAGENGLEVAERGRLPATVLAAYENRHSTAAAEPEAPAAEARRSRSGAPARRSS